MGWQGGSGFQRGRSRPASRKHPRRPGLPLLGQGLLSGQRCAMRWARTWRAGSAQGPKPQPRNGPSGILPVPPGVPALSFLRPLPLPVWTGRCPLPSFLLSLLSILFRKTPAPRGLGSRGHLLGLVHCSVALQQRSGQLPLRPAQARDCPALASYFREAKGVWGVRPHFVLKRTQRESLIWILSMRKLRHREVK